MIQAQSPKKCIKIAKTAGNKAFLVVFAMVVVIQLGSPATIRGVAVVGTGAPDFGAAVRRGRLCLKALMIYEALYSLGQGRAHRPRL